MASAAAVTFDGAFEQLIADLPRRNLTAAELADLVVAIGRRPELWQRLSHEELEPPSSTRLHVDPRLEIWLLRWTNGQRH